MTVRIWFAALGLLFGASYALFMGPLRVADEAGHMYRVYLTSKGVCPAVPAIGYSTSFHELAHAPWTELSRNTSAQDMLNMVDDSKGRPLGLVEWYYIVNLYSCVPYIPAGAAFRVGSFFTDSLLTLMYVGRFANLLFYLAVVILAMGLLPEFELPLAILALMPMSLHQAASLSADGVTIAFSFLLTAYILKLALAGPSRLTASSYTLLLTGALLAGLCKSNAGLMFLLLLIPQSRFPNRRTRWFTIAGLIAAGFATTAIWQVVNRPNGEIYTTLKAVGGIHLDENTAVIFHRPAIFIRAVGRTILLKGPEYLEQFVGRLGFADIRLPSWIPWLYLPLLILLAAAHRTTTRLSSWQRVLLLGVFLFNVAATLTAFWITETPLQYIASDAYLIPIWGRYLIPFALLLLLAISGFAARLHSRWLVLPSLAVVIAANAAAMEIVWDRFQAHSSTIPNRLRMALDLRFAATPENAALLYDNRIVSTHTPGAGVFLVTGGVKHYVPTVSSATSRGFTWPDDILIISDPALASIPLAAPLPVLKSIYEKQLVRRPGPSPEDGKIYFVSDGEKHWISNPQWITTHGFHLPADLHVISPQDLDAIPDGAPL